MPKSYRFRPGGFVTDEMDDAISSPERLAAIARADLLDAPAEDAFDRLARLAVRVLDVPIAMVSIPVPGRQFFACAVGLPEPWATLRETPLSFSVCKHVVAGAAALVVEDARHHPLLRENRAVTELGVVAYAGVPLRTPAGQVLGTFCAIDTKPHAWTEWELAVLEDLAAVTMARIEARVEAAGRTRAERALHEAEDRFKGLVEQSLAGIYILQDGRVTYANRKFAEIFGYAVE